MAQTAADFQKNYRIVVEKIFNNWSNLRLAVEHGMGGRDGQAMAISVMDYTYQYCVGNENITQGELTDVIDDLMDQEFNTVCDDFSVPEVVRNLLRYKQMCMQAQYEQVETELSVLKGKDWLRPDVKITYTPVAGEDSSSDDEESGSEDTGMDMEMDDASEDEKPSSSRVTRSQARKMEKDAFVEPEEGWTTVRGSGKKK